MIKPAIFFLCLSFAMFTHAQEVSPDLDLAKTFMRQGDYSNATLVLRRAYELDPQNMALAKNLALCYFFQQENKKGLEVILPLLNKENVDDQCYQIACNMYQALDQFKEAEKIYKSGLKKFPASGPLYNDLGELLWKKQNFDAIRQWEKGIQSDPSYPANYYNASRHYYFSTDKVWSLIYGEIFVNMEPNSIRSAEIKELLSESYKKLFMEKNLNEIKTKNAFSKKFLEVMQAQSAIASQGVNTESLTMIRTRFILNWDYEKFPYKLFEYHKQLLQEGLFETYNKWLFESTTNIASFQNWINTHAAEFNAFDRMQKNRVFRMPAGQYYQ